jgi:exodeoxyribonuclease V alpha subunit
MHDRVIMVNNNYDKGYFNGDVGKVIDADDYGMEIAFSNKKIYIEKNNFEDVALAYAITIHKSQGSEYENAVIVLTEDSIAMSNRNLIYTAVTRAKTSVTIIETEGALNSAIDRAPTKRNTMLCKMLCA